MSGHSSARAQRWRARAFGAPALTSPVHALIRDACAPLLGLLLMLAAHRTAGQAAGLQARDAWARATAPGAEVAVGYLVLDNRGPADRLVSVATPAAERAELHMMSMDGGVMRMRRVASLALAAHSVLRLEPRGPHIMFIRPKTPFTAGQRIELTLQFERAAPLAVSLIVFPIGSDGPARPVVPGAP